MGLCNSYPAKRLSYEHREGLTSGVVVKSPRPEDTSTSGDDLHEVKMCQNKRLRLVNVLPNDYCLPSGFPVAEIEKAGLVKKAMPVFAIAGTEGQHGSWNVCRSHTGDCEILRI